MKPARVLAGWLCAAMLAGCAGPRRTSAPAGDRELARLNQSARAAFDRGSTALAVTLFQQALTRARALDDAAAIGNAAYNLAACRIAQGEYSEARGLLAESRSELDRAGEYLADVLVLEAKLALWQGRTADALKFSEQALTDAGSAPGPAHRAETALMRGRIACDNRDTDGARSALAEAEGHTRQANSTVLRAGCEQLTGAIALLEGRADVAALAFDREALLCQQARQPGEMVRALARAGDAWRKASQPATAAERYFRAARSSLAQGAGPETARWAGLSLTLAGEAGDSALAERARRLQAEIRKAASPP